jgi:hypothetical protein
MRIKRVNTVSPFSLIGLTENQWYLKHGESNSKTGKINHWLSKPLFNKE